MAKKPLYITPPGRVSFPSIFEPSTFGNKPKFEVTLIWPEGTDLSKLEAEIAAAADAKFGKGKWPKNLRLPLHDNDEKEGQDGSQPAGYDQPGRYMKFWSKNRPRAVHSELEAGTKSYRAAAEHELYAGCWARVSADIYAFSNKEFKTNDVIGGLVNIQFVKDDEPLGGITSNPDDDFSDEDVEAALG